VLAAAAIGGPASVTVDGNTITGNPEIPAALIVVEGEVLVSANQIRTRREGATALQVRSDAISIATNRLRGGNPSAVLDVDPKRAAVVGNLTSNGIEVAGASLISPWDALNIDGIF